MRGTGWGGCGLRHSYRATVGAALLAAALASVLASPPAQALVIDPTFGTGTTTAIDTAIDTAISTIDGLYSNNLTVDVTFTYTNPNNLGNLLSTDRSSAPTPTPITWPR